MTKAVLWSHLEKSSIAKHPLQALNAFIILRAHIVEFYRLGSDID